MGLLEDDAVSDLQGWGLPGDDVPQGALFPGDFGKLPLDTRRALVQILAGPAIDGHRHAKLWTALLRDEAAIRSFLCELFLELVIDRDQQVAFLRQAEAPDLEAPVLLRRAPLTFVDSALLLHLRQMLTKADGQGERAVVSPDELHEHLAAYRKVASTDDAGFTKRISASIDKMKKYSIIQKLREGGERYEISPTLKLLFSAEAIGALTQTYRDLAEGRGSAVEVPPSDGPDQEEGE